MSELKLTPARAEDAAAVLAFESENRAHFERWIASRGDAYYHLAHVEKSLKEAQWMWSAGREYHVLAWHQETLVGRLTIRNIERTYYQKGEIGYRFAEASGGRGFASTAVNLLAQKAFAEFGLHRIESKIIVDNLPSVSVMRKSGFRQFGHARSAVLRHDQWHDLLLFERLHPDFVTAEPPVEPAQKL